MDSFDPNGNLEKVKKILNIIGSPFDSPRDIDLDDQESLLELYNIARNNKIGLFFLESVTKTGDMTDSLRMELRKEREKSKTLNATVERAATILNKAKIRYAIVKSRYGFPAVPNDVDLLILEGSDQYRDAIKHLKDNQFEIVGGHEAPLEICLHDSSRAVHFDDPRKGYASKDPFDVDVYKEVGASHLIYMNKTKLLDQISEISVNRVKANVLKAPGDIALSIFHSIYPERLYTLLLYFHILYTIKELTSADVDEFIKICNDQKLRIPAITVLSITEIIQEGCFGKSARRLTEIREAVGRRKHIKIRKLPYLYPVGTILECFWGKRNDLVFTVSFIQQMISILNPRYARYLARVYKDRTNRDTY